jgi:DNA-binding LacI/PurR family transcriptional regulator
MATIKDVAERARVPTTTVSHVVNGPRFVSQDLAIRVNEAIEATRYRPNALARSLRNKETGTIGMVTPDNSNPFFAEVARHRERLLRPGLQRHPLQLVVRQSA